jgi:hypothetical protein
LKGTIDANRTGVFGLQRKARVIGGAGGWGKLLGPRSYHNDAGVRASEVAFDAAREAGETLGSFLPAAERLGSDYCRDIGPASRTLEQCAGGVPWWVDYAGSTHVRARESAIVDPARIEVLQYDPSTHILELALDDPSVIRINGQITNERLETPVFVREIEFELSAARFRALVWTGGKPDGPSRLAGIMGIIARRATDDRLFGLWRYRVIGMSVDRVQAQAVSKAAGLPDLALISMHPGIAGAHANLTPGSEVLVEFVEGDRTRPIITHFAGHDGVGFLPVTLEFCNGTSPVARVGDFVNIVIPVGTIIPGTDASAGGPFTVGVPGLTLIGFIQSGAPRVLA